MYQFCYRTKMVPFLGVEPNCTLKCSRLQRDGLTVDLMNGMKMVGLKGFEPLPLRLRAGYACPLTPQARKVGCVAWLNNPELSLFRGCPLRVKHSNYTHKLVPPSGIEPP